MELQAAEDEARTKDATLTNLQTALTSLQQQPQQQPAESETSTQLANLQQQLSTQAGLLDAAARDASDKAADAASLRETLAVKVATVSDLSKQLKESNREADAKQQLHEQQLAQRDEQFADMQQQRDQAWQPNERLRQQVRKQRLELGILQQKLEKVMPVPLHLLIVSWFSLTVRLLLCIHRHAW